MNNSNKLTMETFLQAKFMEFVQKKGRITSAVEWAKWLGVPNATLSQWMNGHRDPTGNNVHILAAKLGPVVYDILGLPRQMPNDPEFSQMAIDWFEADDEARKAVAKILAASRARKHKNANTGNEAAGAA